MDSALDDDKETLLPRSLNLIAASSARVIVQIAEPKKANQRHYPFLFRMTNSLNWQAKAVIVVEKDLR